MNTAVVYRLPGVEAAVDGNSKSMRGAYVHEADESGFFRGTKDLLSGPKGQRASVDAAAATRWVGGWIGCEHRRRESVGPNLLVRTEENGQT